jgi:exopolysaccharide production protein ExoQ
MTAWDASDPRFRRLRQGQGDGVRPRRTTSGGEAVSPGATRRQQANARVLQLVDERLVNERLMERHRPASVGWNLLGLRIDADGAFAFILFLPLLFMAQLGMIGAAAFGALVPLYVFVRRERLLRTLWPRLFLFLIPALALFSVLWSQAPKETFKTAIELGLTVMAGLMLSSARDQGAVIKGLALAFMTYVVSAIAFGGTVAIGVGAGGEAFSGLTGSKNLLGDIASAGLIISIATLMLGLRHKQPLWVMLAGAAILLDLYVVLAARSAGALLGLGMGAGAMIALSTLLPAPRALRGFLTAAVALCLIGAGLSYRWLASTLITAGAEIFDKDPTLTGRTYLWYRANDLIVEKPMLGRGYEAFWIQGNVDAEGLWRYFGIQERGGFTFHNTAVELLVSLGWVGLVLTALVALIGAAFLVRRFVEKPSIALVCWISLFLYMVARTPIETIGISPFYFSTCLAFAALGAAFGRVQLPRRAHAPYRAPNVIELRPVDYSVAGWANTRAAPAAGSLRLLHPARRARP